jgi:hypothetical protein
MTPYRQESDKALGLRQPLAVKDVLWIVSPTLLCLLVAAILLMVGARAVTNEVHFYSLFLKVAIYPSIPVAFAAAIYLRRRYGKESMAFSLMSKRERVEHFWCGVCMVWPIASGLAYRVFVQLTH